METMANKCFVGLNLASLSSCLDAASEAISLRKQIAERLSCQVKMGACCLAKSGVRGSFLTKEKITENKKKYLWNLACIITKFVQWRSLQNYSLTRLKTLEPK